MDFLDSRINSREGLWFPNILGSYGNNVLFSFFRSSNHDSHRVYGQWLFRYFSQGKYFSSLLHFIHKLECKVWEGYAEFIHKRSAVGYVSGNRWESDCRSRGPEFDPGPVPYFCGDWSWNNFYNHSPPFRWIIQEGLLSVTSESMCTKYLLTACSSFPRKKCG